MRLSLFWNISLMSSLIAAGSASVSSAKADNWACEVAICLSNPAGSMAVSQCVPPITKLHKHLAKGKSFPLCKSAEGHVNFIRYGRDYYEDCPANAETIYRSDMEHGLKTHKFCEIFTPAHGGRNSTGINRHDRDGNRHSNRPYYEVRTINGKKIYGKVEFQQPPHRAKPNYLEYVVQGQTNRIWW